MPTNPLTSAVHYIVIYIFIAEVYNDYLSIFHGRAVEKTVDKRIPRIHFCGPKCRTFNRYPIMLYLFCFCWQFTVVFLACSQDIPQLWKPPWGPTHDVQLPVSALRTWELTALTGVSCTRAHLAGVGAHSHLWVGPQCGANTGREVLRGSGLRGPTALRVHGAD